MQQLQRATTLPSSNTATSYGMLHRLMPLLLLWHRLWCAWCLWGLLRRRQQRMRCFLSALPAARPVSRALSTGSASLAAPSGAAPDQPPLLLPVPLLDGGHLLYYGFEAARGKALTPRAQEFGFRIGMAFVVTLMLVATYNDIVRLTRQWLNLG